MGEGDKGGKNKGGKEQEQEQEYKEKEKGKGKEKKIEKGNEKENVCSGDSEPGGVRVREPGRSVWEGGEGEAARLGEGGGKCLPEPREE